jgi:hypothetical protein
MAPPDDRSSVISRYLDTYTMHNDTLSNAQKFELVQQTISARIKRLLIISVSAAIFGILLILAIAAIAFVPKPAKPTRLSLADLRIDEGVSSRKEPRH